MIIREMTATFGKLERATLKLGPGLNVLQADNEAGKSTWSAFLRAMLYGIPTGQRDKAGFLAEKNRYAPWSGVALEGSMTLDWNGREVILRRKPRGANPFGTVQAVDGATGEIIPELSVDRPGEVLLGVEREVFERSAFVGQGAMTVDSAPALEKRIAALLTAGQEEVSFSQVQRQLKDQRNRRQHNKTGIIPQLEERIAQQEALLSRASQARLQEAEGAAELESLREEKRLLEQEKGIYKAAAEREKWARFQDSCQDYLRVKEEYEALAAQFQDLPSKEELLIARQGYQENQTLAAALRLKEDEIRQLEESQLEPVEVPRLTAVHVAVSILCAAIAAAACFLLSFYLGGYEDGVGMLAWDLVSRPMDLGSLQFLCAGIGAAVGGSLSALQIHLLKVKKARRRIEEHQLARETQLAQCRQEANSLRTERERKLQELLLFVHRFSPTVTNEFGISAAISRALQGEDLLVPAKARLESARSVVQMARATLESERPPAPVTGTARYPYQETVARLAVTLEELNRKERMVAAAQGELRSLGDVDAIEAQLELDREEHKARLEELAALDLAMSAMEQANSAMQARFSPALNQRAGEVMSALTGGKYDKLTLTRTFDAVAHQIGEVLPHSVLTLSQGTADQLYLAVRLAVCDLAMPKGGKPPLVLDDALIRFDDTRMTLALEHLLERAEQQQILLFSCHSREAAYLRGKQAVITLI